MNLKVLIGSGDKIMIFTLPFLIIGLILNFIYPSYFSVGGPPEFLQILSIVVLIPGVIIWIWSAVLILIKVPQRKLITKGPYALVTHPLYSGVALLVVPWVGFLANSWLGSVIGVVLYVGTRIYSPLEDEILLKNFGTSWEEYRYKIKIPWL